MLYRLIGDAAMVTHLAFLLYVALGGFLTWRWPRTLWIHAPVALYALGITLIGWACPLTHVENWARARAGQTGLPGASFVDHYLTGVVYPEEHLRTVQLAVAAAVLISWIGLAAFAYRGRRKENTP
ncbi:DUF2784 domain-containing protein [Nocardiopsis sp. EMB25]|uniref:DUF2784 domain-containing protein n=1 Tax=Nocardiopsis sp. EMB25 TaxID=2835867 RepID=UPI002285278E|nr:DUF2784 domain-containing protein [Nocardiopsis sp. EMB25]MCY9782983.1 DUF2784 domain-containing protein [Nocardiopsis sp. EMB25]